MPLHVCKTWGKNCKRLREKKKYNFTLFDFGLDYRNRRTGGKELDKKIYPKLEPWEYSRILKAFFSLVVYKLINTNFTVFNLPYRLGRILIAEKKTDQKYKNRKRFPVRNLHTEDTVYFLHYDKTYALFRNMDLRAVRTCKAFRKSLYERIMAGVEDPDTEEFIGYYSKALDRQRRIDEGRRRKKLRAQNRKK